MPEEGSPICGVAGTSPKHTPYTPNTPTPNLQQVLQQHHLGKFLTFYLLG